MTMTSSDYRLSAGAGPDVDDWESRTDAERARAAMPRTVLGQIVAVVYIQGGSFFLPSHDDSLFAQAKLRVYRATHGDGGWMFDDINQRIYHVSGLDMPRIEKAAKDNGYEYPPKTEVNRRTPCDYDRLPAAFPHASVGQMVAVVYEEGGQYFMPSKTSIKMPVVRFYKEVNGNEGFRVDDIANHVSRVPADDMRRILTYSRSNGLPRSRPFVPDTTKEVNVAELERRVDAIERKLLALGEEYEKGA